mgnify:CR=1 FL=1|tara:strand:- start:879 stop:1172 length:294 start_codon:yes stop_codon:yes gene_type:complete
MSRPWLSNTNSRKWKQLEYVLDFMPRDFTSNDMMNFLRYSWEDKGMKNRNGVTIKLQHFSTVNISIFCRKHPDIKLMPHKKNGYNLWRKKNVMDREV